MDKPNLLDALGIPTPNGPTKAPDSMALNVMQLAVKYLLYERAEQTALTAAFAQVVEERHNNFHQKHVEKEGPRKGLIVHWTNCSNQVCCEARDIVASTHKKEVNINPLAAQLMCDYVVNFMPMPANLRLWLTKLDETKLPETESTKREASRIILAN